MFKDVQLSKDLMSEYKALNANLNRFDRDASGESADNVQLDVNVCTTGFWYVRLGAGSQLRFHN
jgi:hypothetical protein